MLLKLGVAIDKLNPEIRRALLAIETVYQEQSQEPVITSTYDGNHMASSLHYHNDAIDLRLPTMATRITITERIKEKLGHDYDVVLESDHIHVEYDPKP